MVAVYDQQGNKKDLILLRWGGFMDGHKIVSISSEKWDNGNGQVVSEITS